MYMSVIVQLLNPKFTIYVLHFCKMKIDNIYTYLIYNGHKDGSGEDKEYVR